MLDNLMTATVDVIRPPVTKGTSGGQKDGTPPTTIYADQPCSVQPVSTSWLVRYAQRHSDTTHTLFFNTALTILTGDQITFGERTFYVLGKRDLIELARVTVVDCKELL